MTVAATYQQNPRTAGRIIDGTAFVVTPDDNRLHTLNGTGTFVWSLAEGPVTLDQVAGALAARYEVDGARARVDAEQFLGDLTSRGILTTKDAPAGKP
jgi:hypothetical protein